MAGKSAKFEVLLTQGAEQDLEGIHDYIAEFDCVANANYVLDELISVVESLSKFPERGSYPKELSDGLRMQCPALDHKHLNDVVRGAHLAVVAGNRQYDHWLRFFKCSSTAAHDCVQAQTRVKDI